jgi:hypothetical protein
MVGRPCACGIHRIDCPVVRGFATMPGRRCRGKPIAFSLN